MSSDLTTGRWAPSVSQLTGSLPDEAMDEVAEAPLLPIPSGPLHDGQEIAGQPPIGQIRSGLKARLLIVDVVAAGATWFALGTIDMPSTTPAREWGAALAALLVTLVTMKVLRLYRARQCVQRGQEVARILVAVAVGTIALKLVRGDWGDGDRMAIVAAGSCFLALVALRSMFGHWLRFERALGRHQRGLIMIGTNDDALAVSTMLNTQPELGYEVRGLIGEPRRRAEWEHLCNGRTLDELPAMAGESGATGVLFVPTRLSASEVRAAIEVEDGGGLHVQVWPGFRGLGHAGSNGHP